MSSWGKLYSYKHLLGIAVAAVVIATIFVPFQKVSAFTVNTPTLPDASGTTITQSVLGEDFSITVDVQSGELLSISSVHLILDNGSPTGKSSVFSSSGTLQSGSTALVKDNAITITPTGTASGYVYGNGFLANGYTYSSYYYTVTGTGYGAIGGNNIGYSSAGPNNNNYVSSAGFLGQTTITISGKLNTALMSVGSHTLDAIINTGAGGNNQDKLVAPQLGFTVNTNTGIVSSTVSSGTNVSLPPITVPGSSTPITITISNVQTGGTVVAEVKTASSLLSSVSGIFTATGAGSSLFNVGSSSATSVGVVFDIDLSSVTLGPGATIDVTIPYDPTLLPAGFDENNIKFFHWNGSTWEDKTLSVDTSANTVTGRLTSLSPVVAGFITSSPSPSTSGGGGGGGGGSSAGGSGSSSIDLTGTYSDEYIKAHPLDKIQLQNSGFINSKGNTIFQTTAGQQVMITTTFKNYQLSSQNYAVIIQIINQDGYTTDMGWVTGKLDSGATTQASRSWTTEEAGSYTAKLFVWDGVSGSPTPLSEVTTKNFVVS